jgi:hypothetical protein
MLRLRYLNLKSLKITAKLIEHKAGKKKKGEPVKAPQLFFFTAITVF